MNEIKFCINSTSGEVDFQVEASDVGKHIIATGLHYIKLALEALVLLLLLSRSVFDSHPT